MRRRSASPSTGSDTNKHVGSRRCTQGRAREACEAHPLRFAIAACLIRFDRVTSAHALSVPAWCRSGGCRSGNCRSGNCRSGDYRPGDDPGQTSRRHAVKVASVKGGFGQRRLRSKAAWVRAIWVAAKPAGRSRANRPEPSALGRSSLRPELELVPKLAASLSKPIANPHRWTAH